MLRRTLREMHPEAALSKQFLVTLCEQYNLPHPLKWHRTPTGRLQLTWILSLAGNSTVVLRRYRQSFDEAVIRYEHSILNHLYRCGFPVPRIIPAADGAAFVSMDGGHYAVFEYCEGSPKTHFLLRKLQPNLIASAGALLARYHKLLESFTPDGRKLRRDGDDHGFVGELDRLHDTVMSTGKLRRSDRYFLKHFVAIREQLLAFTEILETNQDRCSKTIIHGDFGPLHLLVHKGRITAVLDFTNAHRNMRIADVGLALLKFSRGPGPWLDLDIARNFLRAYQGENPLHEDELALLPDWMVRWRLIALYYALKRYYEQRQLGFAARAVWLLKLVSWLQANKAQLRALRIRK